MILPAERKHEVKVTTVTQEPPFEAFREKTEFGANRRTGLIRSGT